MATVRVVRTITYEIDEANVERLKQQMQKSLPIGDRQYGLMKLRVEHTDGPQWPTDGKDVRDLEQQWEPPVLTPGDETVPPRDFECAPEPAPTQEPSKPRRSKKSGPGHQGG